MFYFAEKGVGIEKEDERTLAQFAQAYLDVRLNPHMTVAKYCARFELGLTTTVSFAYLPRRIKSDEVLFAIADSDSHVPSQSSTSNTRSQVGLAQNLDSNDARSKRSLLQNVSQRS